jgi:hypothetical protein
MNRDIEIKTDLEEAEQIATQACGGVISINNVAIH